MPNRPKFKPTETPSGFMVSIPARMSGTGVRERRFFTTKKEAEKFAAKLRSKYHDGQRGGVISHSLAMEAATAHKLLEPHGLSIIDAARDMVRRLEADGSTETFRERYRRVLPHGEMHWSDRYTRDMQALERWLPSAFFKARCVSITPEMIRRAVIEGGANALSTIESRARYVSAIMNYKLTHRKQGEISIMTQDQIKAMFEACENADEKRTVALMIYAGIRPSAGASELKRLDWQAVGEAEIFISSEVSKTNSERIIPITPVLNRLIKGHPKEGSVIPNNWQRRYSELRKAAGLGGAQDITRHTFASHFLVAYGEERCKEAMGHTANSRTLFKHYRRAIREEDGKAFFA